MAYDPVVWAVGPTNQVTVDASSTTYIKGALLAYDGTNWVKANAATFATLYARYILMDSVDAGGSATTTVNVCRSAMLRDADAPYTADSVYYLSGATAGAHTATRPTTGGYLRQVIGHALSTTDLWVEIRNPREVEVPLTNVLEYTGGEGAIASHVALDSGLYEGYQLNAQNEYITYGVTLPDGFVSVLRAEVNAGTDTAGSRTISFTTNSMTPGAAGWDTVTADTSETTKTISTNAAGDPVDTYDFSAALNATSVSQPGAFLAVKMLAADAGTDAVLVFGGRLIVLVV